MRFNVLKCLPEIGTGLWSSCQARHRKGDEDRAKWRPYSPLNFPSIKLILTWFIQNPSGTGAPSCTDFHHTLSTLPIVNRGGGEESNESCLCRSESFLPVGLQSWSSKLRVCGASGVLTTISSKKSIGNSSTQSTLAKTHLSLTDRHILTNLFRVHEIIPGVQVWKKPRVNNKRQRTAVDDTYWKADVNAFGGYPTQSQLWIHLLSRWVFPYRRSSVSAAVGCFFRSPTSQFFWFFLCFVLPRKR